VFPEVDFYILIRRNLLFNVFPEVDFYILLRRKSPFKGLMKVWPECSRNFLLGRTGLVTQSLNELEVENIS
jgi:hypothetical protein